MIYQAGHSVFHRTDAVAKFVWLFAVALTATLLTDVPFIVGLLALVVVTATVFARMTPAMLLRRCFPFLLIGGWLVVVFGGVNVRHGATAIHLGAFTTSRESVMYGVAIGIRVLVLGIASVVFVLTTEPRRLVSDLISYARVPYRMGFAVYAALRFLPQIQSEARTISNARAVRAMERRRGPIGAFESVLSLTVPLLSGALRRVQVTAVAMDSRGFGAHRTRTSMNVFPRNRVGIAVAIFQVVVAAGTIVLIVMGVAQGVQTANG